MEYVVRYLLLILLALPASALETLKPGDKVDDFTMLSVNGFGQRLTEVRGQPLMLIWLDRCNACSETLARYQLLAESLEIDGKNKSIIITLIEFPLPINAAHNENENKN